ncbi:type II secretion system protein J [Pseudoalteromonas fenneropenaei]|uniref:Type II secretion system protein J n=1 Tax=Pseudoalteromonas fenneropenaei TaxID=1737459 RepID=A0ABV7CKN5_9GAMM
MKVVQNSGFTLVEVLISAIILFSAIAVTSQIYKQVSFSSKKASDVTRSAQLSYIAIDLIKAKLQSAKVASTDQSLYMDELELNGVDFNWVAKRQDRVSPAPDFDDINPPGKMFSLFQVTVTSSVNDNFQFKVMVWD